MLSVAMAWFSSDESAILYVFPVLWMTSCFHTIQPVGQNYLSSSLSGGRTESENAVYNCRLVDEESKC